MPKIREAEGTGGPEIRLARGPGRYSPRDGGNAPSVGTAVLAEVLCELLALAESEWCDPALPSPLRVQLRGLKGRLGGLALASETDVAQMLAEEDGDAVCDEV